MKQIYILIDIYVNNTNHLGEIQFNVHFSFVIYSLLFIWLLYSKNSSEDNIEYLLYY